MPRILIERFEELERSNADRAEWIEYSLVVLETLMKQQSAVMELHRELLGKPSQLPIADYEELRQQARDALALVNRLADLYQRVQLKTRG